MNCPHCGADLQAEGVIELVGYVAYPDETGRVEYDSARYAQLDEAEGYLCASCGKSIECTEHYDEGYYQVEAEGSES